MSLTLYYVPQTRAGRARWMLEELAVPYAIEKIDVKARQNDSPAYRKIHPLGHVPALHDSDGDVTMFESAAICMYLADKFPEKRLAPAFGTPARGPYYQWMVFSMAELEPTVAALAVLNRIPEAERDPAKVAEKRARFEQVAGVITKHLVDGDRAYMLGAEFSAADVMMAGVLGWGRILGAPFAPELLAYLQRCTGRTAFKASRAD